MISDARPRARARRYLFLGIDASGLPCLVVGGGAVGARKARTLAGHGAKVTVLAPEAGADLRRMAAAGRVTLRRGTYAPARLRGFRLAVAATSDPELNRRIGRDAESRGLLACVASEGRSGRVIFPATHRQGRVEVAVHSGGRDCTLSQRIRDAVAAALKRRIPGGSP